MLSDKEKELEKEALYGHWGFLTVSPDIYLPEFKSFFPRRRFYNWRETSALVDDLSALLDQHEADADDNHLLALYRAFLGYMLEAVNAVDDSSGDFGLLYQEVIDGYLDLPRHDYEPNLFWPDFWRLAIWEDYGFFGEKQLAFVADLTEEETAVSITFLQQQWQTLQELDSPYYAERAIELWGLIVTEQQQFEQFLPMAERMGARRWRPITRMAEKAEEAGQRELALTIYKTAISQDGIHADDLEKRYEVLKGKES